MTQINYVTIIVASVRKDKNRVLRHQIAGVVMGQKTSIRKVEPWRMSQMKGRGVWERI